MKYFSNLNHGWCDLTIGDFTCQCSYIQNIPLTILKAWKDYKDNDYCVLNIDSEGYEHEIIITDNGIHTITYRGVISYHSLDEYFEKPADKINLLKNLCFDILYNVDEWAQWLCLVEPDKEYYKRVMNEYKKEIIEYAKQIRFPFEF